MSDFDASTAGARVFVVVSERQYDGSAPDPVGSDTPPDHVKLGGWAIAILPQLDSQAIYDFWSMDRYSLLTTDANFQTDDGYDKRKISQNEIFICPSEPGALNEKNGPNSYVCNSGFVGASGPADGIFVLRTDPSDWSSTAAWASGAVKQAPVRSDSIRDSKSQTILFTENAQAIQWYAVSVNGADSLTPIADVATDLNEQDSKFLQGTVFHPNATDTRVIINSGDLYSVTETLVYDNAGTMTVRTELARPSSYHTGHVNCGFADGNTRSVNANIDYKVYQALLTPFGKKSNVPDKEFVITDDVL